MTKKKPSPQNRIWEKERRERLNKTFEDLQRLLPDHEPSSTLTKVEILQRAIELIGKLQKKVKDIVHDCNDPLKEQIQEQERRLMRLLGRNAELTELLRKAKIIVPPCKYTKAEEERLQQSEEKENGNRVKRPKVKQRRSGAAPKKPPVINKKHPSTHHTSTVGMDALALSSATCKSTTSNGEAVPVSCSGTGSAQPAPSSLALRHINGTTVGPGHGVNVTQALLSTPIMTTSVLISNNGNLLQMPLVAPPSSLLIVGSEDVRAKINLKNRRPCANGKGKCRRGKFTIKSIDVIPGRIVNGKIPIPPLRRSVNECMKGSKMARLKRKMSMENGKKQRRSTVDSTERNTSNETYPSASKRAKQTDIKTVRGQQIQSKDNQELQNRGDVLPTAVGAGQSPSLLQSPGIKTICKEQEKLKQSTGHHNTHDTHLDINLNHAGDLPEDIFANLQVPGDSSGHGHHDDGSLSPTAAYLMNFPLVAGGGKAAGNHIDAGDGDECEDGVISAANQQTPKKDSSSGTVQTTSGTEMGGSLLLDNFSSFFNYGQMDSMSGSALATMGHEILNVQPQLAATTTTTTGTTATVATPSTREAGFTNYNTIYQSIDNMLEHRPVAPTRTAMSSSARIPVTSETDYTASVAFTFTLTSGTTTAPTTAQPGTIGTNHFYGSSCGALNPVKPVADDFSTPLKPSIEFTFSLTSTTASQPRTVQSQYTNSSMLATTMTTPSYDTYGYYHKTVPKPANYCPSFNVLDPLLTTEKPATSFTFSLTSSTKTEPSYTQSALATVPTQTSQTYETAPKLSTKHQLVPGECFPAKNVPPKLEKVVHRSAAGAHASMVGNSTVADTTSGLQQQSQHSSPQQASTQQNSQSRYDVSWMAAGAHNDLSSGVNHHHHHSHNHHHQHQQHQQQQQQPYEIAPAQIISSLEFPAATGGYTSSYKSDIFFAHPPGEENNLTWSSPSKLSNILSDTSSPYFPPVTLPSLNGDLALNTSSGTVGNVPAGVGSAVSSGGCKMGTSNAKKSRDTQGGTAGVGQGSDSTPSSSFLSVSQLVNQPSKPYHSGSNADGSHSCQQKPLNNNYSAEALIGNAYSSNPISLSSVGHEAGRKDKLFDYGCSIMESGFGSSSVPSSTALTFNFDTYGAASGADYNKGYNFVSQQNAYVPPTFADGGYGVSASAGGSCAGSSSSGTAGLPYYGKTSSQGYYQQAGPGVTGSCSSAANYHHPTLPQPAASAAATVGQDFTPYYLPTFGEKTHAVKQFHGTTHGSVNGEQSVGKLKKTHKATAVSHAAVDYPFPAVVTSTVEGTSNTPANYSYSSLSNCTAAVGSLGTAVVSGDPAPQMEPHGYSNYHHHHQSHHQQQQHQQQRAPHLHQYGNVTADESSSILSSTLASHKASTSASSYNYSQYSTPSVGFSSVKSSKITQHGRSHHEQHTNQPAYALSQSHHQLDLSSCLNPPTGASFGNHPPQSDLVPYGPESATNHSQHRQQHQAAQNTSHYHHPHQQQTHAGSSANTTGPPAHVGSTNGGSCGTLTNFNLSAICPEINDKTGRSRDGTRGAGALTVPPSVASIMTHW